MPGIPQILNISLKSSLNFPKNFLTVFVSWIFFCFQNVDKTKNFSKLFIKLLKNSFVFIPEIPKNFLNILSNSSRNFFKNCLTIFLRFFTNFFKIFSDGLQNFWGYVKFFSNFPKSFSESYHFFKIYLKFCKNFPLYTFSKNLTIGIIIFWITIKIWVF